MPSQTLKPNNKQVSEELEPNDQQALEQIANNSIPNTRELQKLRKELIGKQSSYEKHMQQHYPKHWETPRIVRLSIEDQLKIANLSIPLSFPSLDWGYENINVSAIDTNFYRFQGNRTALHLTTEQGLNKLLQIFTQNQIPIKNEKACGPILDSERTSLPAISVPHSWYVDNYDPHEDLFQHQFVVYDGQYQEEILAYPYIYKKETTRQQNTSEDPILDEIRNNIQFRKKITTHTEYKTDAYFANPFAHSHNANPAKQVRKSIEGQLQSRFAQDLKPTPLKKREFAIMTSKIEYNATLGGKVTLLRVDDPITIFRPDWIQHDS
jgi:hypothetical protein